MHICIYATLFSFKWDEGSKGDEGGVGDEGCKGPISHYCLNLGRTSLKYNGDYRLSMELDFMPPSSIIIQTVHIASLANELLRATSCFVILKLLFTVEFFLAKLAGHYSAAFLVWGQRERGSGR